MAGHQFVNTVRSAIDAGVAKVTSIVNMGEEDLIANCATGEVYANIAKDVPRAKIAKEVRYASTDEYDTFVKSAVVLEYASIRKYVRVAESVSTCHNKENADDSSVFFASNEFISDRCSAELSKELDHFYPRLVIRVLV